MGEFIRIEQSSVEGVAILRLDRPKVNALNKQLCQEIIDAADELEARDDVRAVVVWGGPRIFAAGADIAAFPTGEGHRDPSWVEVLNEGLNRVEGLPYITISAVNGVALGGGCELSMTTDFRICGQSSLFGQPEILLGITPGGGGTQRMPRLIGLTRAKEICYSGRNVAADEALQIGLVSAVHPDDEVLDRAVAMVARFASGPAALTNIKRAIQDGYNMDMPDAMAVEKREFVGSFQTDDAVTGITSFLENGPGKATFSGR
jgi:enoyl-CoA hydratase/carnithine racemase